MKLLLLFVVITVLGASKALKCNDCIMTGKTYFVTKDNEISCEDIDKVGRKSAKFTAKTSLECAILLSVLEMIEAAEEASPILTTLKPDYSNNKPPFSPTKSIATTEKAQLTTATPLQTTTSRVITAEEPMEKAGTTTIASRDTTTVLTDSMETSILEKNSTKIRGRRYEMKRESRANATQLQKKVLESFDSYIYRAEKNLQRIQLMFHRQMQKFLPRLKSNLTVV